VVLVTLGHDCNRPKVTCSKCRACQRTRFVHRVPTKRGIVDVLVCTHCDFPQEVARRG